MYTRSETVFTGVSDNEENDKIIASIARYTAEPVQAESEGVLSFCTSVYATFRCGTLRKLQAADGFAPRDVEESKGKPLEFFKVSH